MTDDVNGNAELFGKWYSEVLVEFAAEREGTDEAEMVTFRARVTQKIMSAPAIQAAMLNKRSQELENVGTAAARTRMTQRAANSLISITSTQSPTSSSRSAADFSTLSIPEKTEALIQKFGTNGGLDLSATRIPKRYADCIPDMRNYYKIKLQAAVTLGERQILVSFAKCRTEKDVRLLLADLFLRDQVTDNEAYLRSAIDMLNQVWLSKRLQSMSNDEGWMRQNLYAGIWDRLFLARDLFYTKRAECYSAVIKELQEKDPAITQQRVDFILRSTNERSDYLSSEEKPYAKNTVKDLENGRQLQKHMLSLWESQLKSTVLAAKLEAMTCQWSERKMTIYGTRMLTSGKFLSYLKAKIEIPAVHGYYATAAKALMVLLSVKREVTLNYIRMVTMLEALNQYDVEALHVADDEVVLSRTDSSDEEEEQSDVEEEDDDQVLTMDPVKEKYVLERYEKVKHVEEDLVTEDDWEKLLIDDEREDTRKRQKVSHSSSTT